MKDKIIKILVVILIVLALIGVVHGISTSNFGHVVTQGNATFNGTWVNITTGVLYGNQSWEHFNYPAACTDGYSITKLGDSVTCTAVGSVIATNVNMSEYNITNNNRISWSNGAYIESNSTCLKLFSPDHSGTVEICNA